MIQFEQLAIRIGEQILLVLESHHESYLNHENCDLEKNHS